MARLEIRTSEHVLAVTVTLSRRNLLSLLAKLDIPGSFRTIFNNDVFVDGEQSDAAILILHAEEDGPHYARRVDPPGPMTSETEAVVRRLGGWTPGGQG